MQASSRASSADARSRPRRCARARLDRGGPGTRSKATSAESTFGGGRNTVRATGMEPGPARVEPDQHRDRAVCLRPGLGEEAVGHLPLHHHAPAHHRRNRRQALDDEWRRDVVREVRRRACRGAGSSAARSSASASPKTSSTFVRSARASRSGAVEAPVELDGVDVRDPIGEEGRQHAETRADLQDDVLRPQPCEALDHPEHVPVDEEVLAERLLGSDADHASARPNAAVAFASICASSAVELVASGLGERGQRETDVHRLVGSAADGLRRKVRACRSRRGSCRRGHVRRWPAAGRRSGR